MPFKTMLNLSKACWLAAEKESDYEVVLQVRWENNGRPYIPAVMVDGFGQFFSDKRRTELPELSERKIQFPTQPLTWWTKANTRQHRLNVIPSPTSIANPQILNGKNWVAGQHTLNHWMYLTHEFPRPHAIIQVIHITIAQSSSGPFQSIVSFPSWLPSTSRWAVIFLYSVTSSVRLYEWEASWSPLEHMFVSLMGRLTSPKAIYQEHSA